MSRQNEKTIRDIVPYCLKRIKAMGHVSQAKDLNNSVMEILDALKLYYHTLKKNQVVDLEDLTAKIQLKFSKEVSCFIISKVEIEKKYNHEYAIVSPSLISRVLKPNSKTKPGGLRADFFCMYAGFAGEKGFYQKKSLYDFFKIEKYREYFSDEDIMDFLHFEKKEDLTANKEDRRHGNGDDDKVIKVEIVNLPKNIETKKNEFKNSKTEGGIRIPVLKTKLYKQLLWKIGFRKWVYHFNNNANLPLEKQEFSPFALKSATLKQLLRNYIDTDFQQDRTLYDASKKRDKNILSFLYNQVIKKANENATTYYFIFSSSGVGKTTLLLKLFIKARTQYLGKRKIYILPFIQRHLVYNFTLAEKQNAILLLDAIDEDFSLNKKSDIKIDEFRENTKDFNKVVITSRSQFFRSESILKDFVEGAGNIAYSYNKVIVLCPFTDRQINKYLKKKFFGNVKSYYKALKVYEYIGDDIFHRQLLIANIEKLFDVLDNEDALQEIKGCHLFSLMLENWRMGEKTRVKEIVKKEKDTRVTAFEQTMEFCKVLARGFLQMQQTNHFGFSWEELQEKFQEIKNFDKTNLLVNRTFLLLDANNLYRFAHSSILDFFLAQIAAEDEDFYQNYFQHSEYIIENDFAKSIYEQYVAYGIYKISVGPYKDYIHFTLDIEDVIEYANDMRFEPYFILTPEGRYIDYYERPWNSFDNLIQDISNYKKIIGIKFLNQKPLHENFTVEAPDAIKFRQECVEKILPLLRFLPNLICLDLSNINLDDQINQTMKNSNLWYLNLRDTKLRENSHIASCSFGANARFENYEAIIQPIDENTELYRQEKEPISFLINNKEIRMKEIVFVVVDYDPNLFEMIQSSTPSIDWCIFLSREDLENDKEYLEAVNKIRVLSKIRGFNYLFFTEDRILADDEIIHCFPNIRKNKLQTGNIEYFEKAGNYVYYSSVMDHSIIEKFTCFKGFNAIYQKNIFSKYRNSFPAIKEDELSINIGLAKKIPHNLDLFKEKIKELKKSRLKTLNVDDLFSLFSFNDYKNHLSDCDIISINLQKRTFNDSVEISNARKLSFEEFKARYPKNVMDLKNILSRFKHIITHGHYLGQDISNYLKKNRIISFFHTVNCKTIFNIINNSWESLERLGIDLKLTDDIVINFEQFSRFKKLEEFFLKITQHVAYKKQISFVNFESFIKQSQIRKLVLDFHTFNRFKVNQEFIENSSLQYCFIHKEHFAVLNANIKYKALKEVYIRSVYQEMDSIDFKFLENCPNLETLTLPDCKNFLNTSFISRSNLKSLTITLNFQDFDRLSIFSELIGTIANSKIKEIHWRFTHLNSYFETLESETLKNTFVCLFSFLQQLNVSENSIQFSSESCDSIIRKRQYLYKFDLIDILTNKTLNIITQNKNEMNTKMDFGIGFSSFVENLISSLQELFSIKQIYIDDVLIPQYLIIKRELNIYENRSINLNKFGRDYFFNKFLNFKYDTIVNKENFSVSHIPYKHIRFVNTTPSQETFKDDLFLYVEKISFSSLKDLDFNILVAECGNLKEIELLAYFFPEDEKYMLKEYENKISKISVKNMITNKEEYVKIKFTVNYSTIKVLNADKGLFETEVREIVNFT